MSFNNRELTTYMSNYQFSKQDQEAIVNAIRDAEKDTSGEVRVHIDKKCPEDVLDRAAYWFEKLKMHKTELRTGGSTFRIHGIDLFRVDQSAFLIKMIR